MDISVIIPTYNRAQWLAKAIDSVLTQSFAPREIIVVDDGSSDETQAILARYPVRSHFQQNAGPSAARNAGARLAQGQWLAFLDSDDSWCPEKLEKQVNAHRLHPHIQLSYTNELWFRNGQRCLPKKQHRKESGWIYPRALELCLISPSSVMLSRALFENLRGFDEQLWAAEDYDMWLRICAYHEVLFVDDALIIKHGGHADQLSSQRGIDRYRVMALEKILLDPKLKSDYRKMTLENLKERYRILVLGFRKYNKHAEADEYDARLQYWNNKED